MSDIQAVTPDLDALVRLFYREPADLGRFEEVDWHTLARDYRMLLAHDSHMTVTVERYHNGPVDVRVLQTSITPTHYARKILLARHSDGAVVQFGIMRLDLCGGEPGSAPRDRKPAHAVGEDSDPAQPADAGQLRKVLKVTPGPDLRRLFGMRPDQVTYGRTALIHLDGEPAVELLEIVTPLWRTVTRDDRAGAGKVRMLPAMTARTSVEGSGKRHRRVLLCAAKPWNFDAHLARSPTQSPVRA